MKIFLTLIIGLINFSQAQEVSDPIQKLADEPKDQRLEIKINSRTYCYVPTFTSGDGFFYVDNCNENTIKARYDVFQRIAFKVNSKWVCITAPDNVTGYESGYAKDSWGNALIRACALNDPNQRWIVKDGAFYTVDGVYRLQDYKWYLVVSKPSTQFTQHTISDNMKDWLDTIAKPVNLTIKTPISWLFADSSEWILYYLANNQSYADVITPLYYNPENGHIAQYYWESGAMYCMQSNNGNYNWNWVSWVDCNDEKEFNRDNLYFEPSLMNGNSGAILDKNRNVLRVSAYGSNWGVPYTVKQSYLARDTQFSPRSIFIMSPDIDTWSRFSFGNLGDGLNYCPSPGVPISLAAEENYLPNIKLPPSFTFTDAWINRLYAIATSADGTTQNVGICGVCMLQAYEMIAELNHNFVAPPSGSGFFFNIEPGSNPISSFRLRFPDLAERIEEIERFFDLPLQFGEDQLSRLRRVVYSMSLALIPQNNWYASEVAGNRRDIRSLVESLFRAPVGTVWLYTVMREGRSGGSAGHAEPLIRTPEGLVAIPTNAPSFTMETFRRNLTPFRNVNDFMDYLSVRRTREVFAFGTFRLLGQFEGSYDAYVSINNCTGEGPGRRGTGSLPLSSLVNQCSSGRCSIQ